LRRAKARRWTVNTADDRRGRITIDDPAHGGQAATFDFTDDGVSRAGISFSLDSMGPRFGVADLAALNEQKLSALQADAFKRLSGARKAYLESVTIGAHPFVRQAGAHAIGVRLRDIPEDFGESQMRLDRLRFQRPRAGFRHILRWPVAAHESTIEDMEPQHILLFPELLKSVCTHAERDDSRRHKRPPGHLSRRRQFRQDTRSF
jgi:hypothetical protein